jgi:predicted kinase
MINTYQRMKAVLPYDASKEIDWENLLSIFPHLNLLSSTPQDPLWHGEGDVWTHTKMVCEAIVSSNDYRSADVNRKFVLFYSALFHDIAKGTCTQQEPGGAITSKGHCRRGAVDTRILLWRAGVPFEVREDICRIIAVHQTPFWIFKDCKDNPAFMAHKLSWEVPSIKGLCAVAEADVRGRICPETKDILDDIELFRVLAGEEGCSESPRVFPDPHTRVMYFRSNGSTPAGAKYYKTPGSSVTLLCGLPASGKDTWARVHAEGRTILSYDDARRELNLKHGSKAGASVQLVQSRCKELLRRHEPFIWNATHLSTQMRGKALDLLFAYNASVEIVYLEAPEDVIKGRNSKRDTTLKNVDIDKMLCRWEVPLPIEGHGVEYRAQV